jgi:general secretion pathway protein C
MSIAQLLGEKPTQRSARWLPLALSVVLAIWFAWVLVQLLWSFFPGEDEPAPQPLATLASAALPSPNAASTSLAGYHLFGQTPAGEFPNAPDAPETQLKLKLIGTAAGRDPKSGVAVIVDEAGKQKQYQAGEIVGQATLDAIYPDRVTLMFQGRLETLRLAGAAGTRANANSTAGASNGANAFAAGQSVSATVPTIGSDPNAYVNTVGIGAPAAFEAVRAQAIANPQAMMGMLAPVFDANGNLNGVKLNAGANEPLLAKAGIQASDIIVSVNGTRIDSIAKGQEIANNLSTANEAVIIVRREGREITLPAVRFR